MEPAIRASRENPKDRKILGSMESPGHWLARGRNGDIYIASLTGNIFRWYPGWRTGREEVPAR
jgi:hypothetical protein